MPHFGPIKRQNLIRYLRQAGFEGPIAGGKHPYMAKGELTFHIPNPHEGDIGVDLLSRLLKQAGLSRTDWEEL